MEGVFKRVDGNYNEWADWKDSRPDGDTGKNCAKWDRGKTAFSDEDCGSDKPFMCEYGQCTDVAIVFGRECVEGRFWKF